MGMTPTFFLSKITDPHFKEESFIIDETMKGNSFAADLYYSE